MNNCDGEYIDSYVCNVLCDEEVRGKCRELIITKGKEKMDEKNENTSIKNEALNEIKNKITEKVKEELSLTNVKIIALFEAKSYSKLDVIKAFFEYFQRYDFTFETKETYVKIFKEPEHKICFYIFYSKKPSLEVKNTKEKLEKLSKYITKEAANITIQFETEEDSVIIAETLGAIFDFRIVSDIISAKEHIEETKKELKIEKPDAKVMAVRIAKAISESIKNGTNDKTIIDNEVAVREFLTSVDIEVTEDVDLPKLLSFIKERYYR